MVVQGMTLKSFSHFNSALEFLQEKNPIIVKTSV